MQYPAVITKEGQNILADFPDCPGCQTFVEEGESIETAAQEALEGWLESNLHRDLVPPRPSAPGVFGYDQDVIFVQVEPLLAVRLSLRWARDDADLTQARLAKQLGMTQQQVAKLEAGGNPTLSTLSRVAEGLGRRVVISLEKPLERSPQLARSQIIERVPKLERSASLARESRRSESGSSLRVRRTAAAILSQKSSIRRGATSGRFVDKGESTSHSGKKGTSKGRNKRR